MLSSGLWLAKLLQKKTEKALLLKELKINQLVHPINICKRYI
jgi:hypothetical protein